MTFSVIMPIYNAAPYLREAIDSVCCQTFADWELICVDDGSTDGSAAILDEISVTDSRVRVIHQANQGVAVARNRGLDKATGDWITWIDADDLYAPWRLEELVEIINAERPDLVRTKMVMGNRISLEGFVRSGYHVFDGQEATENAWRTLMPMGMLWMFAVKRELYAENRCIPGMRIKEEFPICAKIANRVSKIVQSDSRSYFYRQIETSAMKSRRTVEDCLRLLDAVELISTECNLYLSCVSTQLRKHCECDIVDWVLANPACEGLDRICQKYAELKARGIFTARSIMQWRYRLPMWWFSLAKQVWPIRFVDCMLRLVRGMRDKRSCL